MDVVSPDNQSLIVHTESCDVRGLTANEVNTLVRQGIERVAMIQSNSPSTSAGRGDRSPQHSRHNRTLPLSPRPSPEVVASRKVAVTSQKLSPSSSPVREKTTLPQSDIQTKALPEIQTTNQHTADLIVHTIPLESPRKCLSPEHKDHQPVYEVRDESHRNDSSSCTSVESNHDSSLASSSVRIPSDQSETQTSKISAVSSSSTSFTPPDSATTMAVPLNGPVQDLDDDESLVIGRFKSYLVEKEDTIESASEKTIDELESRSVREGPYHDVGAPQEEHSPDAFLAASMNKGSFMKKKEPQPTKIDPISPTSLAGIKERSLEVEVPESDRDDKGKNDAVAAPEEEIQAIESPTVASTVLSSPKHDELVAKKKKRLAKVVAMKKSLASKAGNTVSSQKEKSMEIKDPSDKKLTLPADESHRFDAYFHKVVLDKTPKNSAAEKDESSQQRPHLTRGLLRQSLRTVREARRASRTPSLTRRREPSERRGLDNEEMSQFDEKVVSSSSQHPVGSAFRRFSWSDVEPTSSVDDTDEDESSTVEKNRPTTKTAESSAPKTIKPDATQTENGFGMESRSEAQEKLKTRKILSKEEISQIVLQSMERAQKAARDEVRSRLMTSPQQNEVEDQQYPGKSKSQNNRQKEAATMAREAMHRAKESAQDEIRALVKESFKYSREPAQEEIRQIVREAMQRARASAREEMSDLLRKLLRNDKSFGKALKAPDVTELQESPMKDPTMTDSKPVCAEGDAEKVVASVHTDFKNPCMSIIATSRGAFMSRSTSNGSLGSGQISIPEAQFSVNQAGSYHDQNQSSYLESKANLSVSVQGPVKHDNVDEAAPFDEARKTRSTQPESNTPTCTSPRREPEVTKQQPLASLREYDTGSEYVETYATMSPPFASVVELAQDGSSSRTKSTDGRRTPVRQGRDDALTKKVECVDVRDDSLQLKKADFQLQQTMTNESKPEVVHYDSDTSTLTSASISAQITEQFTKSWRKHMGGNDDEAVVTDEFLQLIASKKGKKITAKELADLLKSRDIHNSSHPSPSGKAQTPKNRHESRRIIENASEISKSRNLRHKEHQQSFGCMNLFNLWEELGSALLDDRDSNYDDGNSISQFESQATSFLSHDTDCSDDDYSRGATGEERLIFSFSHGDHGASTSSDEDGYRQRGGLFWN